MKCLRTTVFARTCRILALLATIVLTGKSQADDFTTDASQPDTLPAQTWNDAVWEPGPVSPSEGNTYTVLAGGCIWSPPLAGVQVFPGDSLILEADARLKVRAVIGAAYRTTLDFPGADGSVGLILNGGTLQAVDGRPFTIAGRIAVTADSVIDHGADLGSFVITAQIEGTGNLTLINGNDRRPLDIGSADNTFSGTWVIKKGCLKGSVNGALGSGDIVIANHARLELDYDIQTPGTLTLLGSNSVVDLHQDCQFGAVSINGSPLAPGTYTYAELAAQFPGNFVADGSGSIKVASSTEVTTIENDDVTDSSQTTPEEGTDEATNRSLPDDAETAAVSQPTPTVPSGVMVFMNSESEITVQWNPSTVAVGSQLAGYKVYRNGALIASTTDTSYSDTGLVPGASYCYAITAVDLLGNTSPVSAQACATSQSEIDASAPSSPSGLMVFAISPTQVMLFWNRSTSLTGYRVYRNDVLIDTTADTTYSDGGLTPDVQYCYSVAAYDDSGHISARSAQACAPVQAGPVAIIAPSNLAATAVATNQINLTWKDNSDNENGFRIERYQTATATWIQIATVGANLTSYSDVDLTPSTTHIYRVYAYNSITF